ncbi:MAG: MBG domain-containing protein [Clostridia bacterium]|nr:MBG domain-containing protein [Clostridia bacterium]
MNIKRWLILFLGLVLIMLPLSVGMAVTGIMGDTDGNNEVTANDAALILRDVVQIDEFDYTQEVLGDLDHDGSIAAADAAHVLRFIVQLNDKVELVFEQESEDFSFIPEANEAEITGYNGEAKDIVIPETLTGHPVVSIKAGAFEGLELNSITFECGLIDGIVEAGIPDGTVIYYPADSEEDWVGLQEQLPNCPVVPVGTVAVTFEVSDTVQTYDGTQKSITAVPSVADAPFSIVYSQNGEVKTPIAAGVYDYQISIDHSTYIASGTNLSGTLTIEKATYDMTGVTFSDATYVQNLQDPNETYSIEISGTLPEGVTVSYWLGETEFTPQRELGRYMVTAKFAGDYDNYNEIGDMNAVLTIEEADLIEVGFTVEGLTHTYDGTEKGIVAATDAAVEYRIEYTQNGAAATPINAGAYRYDIIVTTAGYKAAGDNVTGTLTIEKATYDMTGVSFENAAFERDPQNPTVRTLTISGTLPEGVTVSYWYNDEAFSGTSDLGEYEITAKFAGDADNFNAIPDMTATLTISKLKVSFTVSGLTQTYDGESKAITATPSVEGVGFEVKYLSGGLEVTPQNAGTYTYEISLTNSGYELTGDNVTGTLTIAKATYDMSGITFPNGEFEQNNENQLQYFSIEIQGTLPEDVSVSYWLGDLPFTAQSAQGTYIVTAKFLGDSVNYNAIPDMTATMTIKNSWTPGWLSIPIKPWRTACAES